jgi:hypothetical protein
MEEYFKRDLTEAEEEQLSRELSASPEDALAFAQSMEGLYKANGLPEPVWTEKPLPRLEHKAGWVQALVPGALILVLLGFLSYRFLSRNDFTPETAVQPSTPSLPLQSVERAPVEKPAVPVKKNHPSLPARVSSAPVQPPPAAPAVNLPSPRLPITAPAAGAPPAAPAQGKQYEELSVVVEPTTSGLVTVRVYDSANHEVRMLFAGILPAAKKTFTWDGKTNSGALAPPGTYFIEVKSGLNVMRQQVKVEPDGN